MTNTLTLNNGVAMPRLGLGTWDVCDAEGLQVLDWALKAGYRLFDSAAFYGNENVLGRALHAAEVAREELFVTTKLWNDAQLAGTQMAAFEASLNALGMDYVDLYLVHWPMPGKIAETWAVMEAIYTSGRARAIGVSNFHENHLSELLAAATVVPAINQIELHPHLSQVPLAAACQEHGITVECWKPLGGRRVSELREGATLADIGAAHGKTAAQVTLRWELQRGFVTIPKSANRQRLAQNLDVFDFELSAAEMAAVDAMNTNTRYGEDPDRVEEYDKLMGRP